MAWSSSGLLRRLEGEEERGGGLDPLRDATDLVERQERHRVDRQHGRQNVGGGECGFDPGGASLGDVVHGVPPVWSGPHLSNGTATEFGSAESLLSFWCGVVYTTRSQNEGDGAHVEFLHTLQDESGFAMVTVMY
jgi:hypothetical protein